MYVLSGSVKGENIQGNSIGANLFVGNGYNHSDSENSTGTFDWKTVTMDFIGPPEGTVTIGCRLGFFGSTVTGTAYFDDISVQSDETYRVVEGRHITLFLEQADSDPTVIQPETLTRWVGELDSAYDDYADLVGATPFDGAKIGILSTRTYPGGWAVAGNPILWHEPYVRGELSRVESDGNWSFGILHEIGHDFDIEDRWNFDAEFFANFKMYFVAVRLNAKVSPGGDRYYTGEELREYYRLGDTPGETAWGNINFRFITMADQLGWEPFQKTFRFFLGLSGGELPQTRVEKFNLFLDKLTEFSGRDARSFFQGKELAWALEYLKG
jgi:Peptidase M60, enhancin and enhancin-like